MRTGGRKGTKLILFLSPSLFWEIDVDVSKLNRPAATPELEKSFKISFFFFALPGRSSLGGKMYEKRELRRKKGKEGGTDMAVEEVCVLSSQDARDRDEI